MNNLGESIEPCGLPLFILTTSLREIPRNNFQEQIQSYSIRKDQLEKGIFLKAILTNYDR